MYSSLDKILSKKSQSTKRSLQSSRAAQRTEASSGLHKVTNETASPYLKSRNRNRSHNNSIFGRKEKLENNFI